LIEQQPISILIGPSKRKAKGSIPHFAKPPQQPERIRRISVIMGFAEDDQVWQAYLATFRQRLQDFGWSEGRNVRFDYRFTGESTERMRATASEVVAAGPDVIFVSKNPVVSAVLQVTRTVPIVFT
jgi:putative ABC transport system substrate-binding protein